MIEEYSTGSGGSTLFHRRARGTEVAPELPQVNDIVATRTASAWARDAPNATTTWILLGTDRFSVEAVDVEGRVGGRYDLTLSSGVSASPLVKMRVTANGSVMAGNTVTGTPTADLDIFGQTFRIRTAKTPATSAEACNAGTIVWDTGFVYVCTATNTWERAALTTW
jgi:hypothetical protein